MPRAFARPVEGRRSGWTALPVLAAAVLAMAGLVTGAAIVVFFLTRLSVPLGMAATGSVVVAAGRSAWRRLDDDARREAKRRAWAGVRAGTVATLAYDVTRVAVVALFPVGFRPFEALPLFGQLLLGVPAGSGVARTAGLAYHLANGIGFGLAFTMVAGRRGVPAGIVWGLFLEAAMLAFYPGWLDIRARAEFFSVSLAGHVAYGASLGWTARRLLRSPAEPREVHQ